MAKLIQMADRRPLRRSIWRDLLVVLCVLGIIGWWVTIASASGCREACRTEAQVCRYQAEAYAYTWRLECRAEKWTEIAACSELIEQGLLVCDAPSDPTIDPVDCWRQGKQSASWCRRGCDEDDGTDCDPEYSVQGYYHECKTEASASLRDDRDGCREDKTRCQDQCP